ncbi:MAG: hypothetical protein ACE5HD_10215 [Acidobacteriota bacterium]
MTAGGFYSRQNLILIGRLMLFLGTIGVLLWLTNTAGVRRVVVEPITRVSVMASHLLISLVDGGCQRQGTLLLGPRMTLDVEDGCNGVVAIILFTAAVVAHEAGLGAKAVGLGLGMPAIWLFNLVRIISLYAVSVLAPARVEFFHIYFWQTLIIIFVVIAWYRWAIWAPPPPAARPESPPDPVSPRRT